MLHGLELLHRYPDVLEASDGTRWRASAYGAPSEDGRVAYGWLVFFELHGVDARPTDRETTQPDLAAARYWATGLERVYLEGALARALSLPPEKKQAVTDLLLEAAE